MLVQLKWLRKISPGHLLSSVLRSNLSFSISPILLISFKTHRADENILQTLENWRICQR